MTEETQSADLVLTVTCSKDDIYIAHCLLYIVYTVYSVQSTVYWLLTCSKADIWMGFMEGYPANTAASPNACMTTVELCSAASGLRRANGSTVRLKLTSIIIMITMIIII